MTRLARVTTVAIVSLTLLAGCRSAKSRALGAAEDTSKLASGNQKQLWQDVADKGNAPGLERVPVVQAPVQPRQRPSPPGRSTPVPAQPITIPELVEASIRIVDYPPEPETGYEGRATVLDVAGDRIRLDLGSKRTLTVLARARKPAKPGEPTIPVRAGDIVDVAYVSQRLPDDPHTVIGIRTDAGAGIVHVVQGGNGKLTIEVPLFKVKVEQLDGDSTRPVRITAPSALNQPVLQPGAIEKVGDVTVFIVGSAGVGKGTDVRLIEGKPYALNVMVWKP